MRIILYNPNSFGGNHRYCLELAKAFRNKGSVDHIALVLPQNAPETGADILSILRPDISHFKSRVFQRFYFLFRTFANPFIFYQFLKKAPPSFVLFNDFDQWSAWLWKFWYRKLKKKHGFGVVLHDPDRDNYTPVKWLSACTMQAVMSIMDIAFFHEYLPQKVYYEEKIPFVNIPHGIYRPAEVDESFLERIRKAKGDCFLIGLIGNIREEKNYDLFLSLLPSLPDVKLLIAGRPANSSVQVNCFKELAQKLGVSGQVIWEARYLSESEFSAAIFACDLIGLYYRPSFVSQSGILNAIAPFKKPIIVSDTPSALRDLTSRFKIGTRVPAQDEVALKQVIWEQVAKPTDPAEWESYLQFASWEGSSELILSAFKKVCPEISS